MAVAMDQLAAELLEWADQGSDGVALLRHARGSRRPGTFVALSSFGADPAPLPSLVAAVVPDTPMLVMDTK